MTWLDIALQVVVALAAMLQAVTGIGFALIAGPVILLASDSASAFSVSALLSFQIALVLAPGLWRAANPASVRAFTIGSCAGLPLGAGLLAMAEVTTLKLAAGAVLLALLPAMLRPPRADGHRIGWRHGLLSGILGGALTMPGPATAIALAASGAAKTEIRATILVYFVWIHPPIILAQWGAGAVSSAGLAEAAATALTLAPATLFGTLVGRWLAPHVRERLFRRAVFAGIAVIAASLLFAGIRSFSA
ncbi:hypothetical protein LNKW23_09260 [Paralimibaculum aggregatum]|uniref:Probable membrane transporter protein n=1 Tax=Paralimibaculum aggregatum TaxID=3036245 RepID=A0ABQ6LLL3_9RHOB|nr:TSUP family transporter [Limibaculum sp. NKW23]GMG81713.1 hypothetical protein LNKW23_09260 [Limibaculum sp. NKW23]